MLRSRLHCQKSQPSPRTTTIDLRPVFTFKMQSLRRPDLSTACLFHISTDSMKYEKKMVDNSVRAVALVWGPFLTCLMSSVHGRWHVDVFKVYVDTSPANMDVICFHIDTLTKLMATWTQISQTLTYSIQCLREHKQEKHGSVLDDIFNACMDTNRSVMDVFKLTYSVPMRTWQKWTHFSRRILVKKLFFV